MRLKDLILDDRCQMRVESSEEYAQQLAEYLQEGGSLPPLVAFRDAADRPGPAYLADGWHRRRAREINGERTAEVDVRGGGLRAAILYATGCNGRSPLRPKADDFRKAVGTLLLDPEWGQWSVREVARQVGCGRRLVSQVRCKLAELSGSVDQIAATPAGIKVERNGTVYTMKKFRDMNPAEQSAAVQTQQDKCRREWLNESKEHAGRLVSLLANLKLADLRKRAEVLAADLESVK